MAKSDKGPGKNAGRARGATSGNRPGAAGAEPSSGGPLGFEAMLWQAADKLRNNIDAAGHKHVVLSGRLPIRHAERFVEAHL